MKYSILIIDDDSAVRNEVKRVLNEAGLFHDYYESADGVEGFKVLLNKSVDLILCDVEMPGIDGIKFLGMKQGRPEYNDIPVIMLTGLHDVKLKVQTMDLGASDYVTKPFDPAELIARVQVHLKTKLLQDELREKNKKLEELSNTDSLTRLYNRRYFMELFDLEFQRAKRYQSYLSFIMIDIDHFKGFNDTYGHLLGDSILLEVSTLFKENLRRYDQIGRYGGEEFVLMMPETDLDGAMIVAERHRSRIEEFAMYEGDKKLNVTISLGVASYPHPDVETLDDLIRLADDALLESKRTGRNRIAVGYGSMAKKNTDKAS